MHVAGAIIAHYSQTDGYRDVAGLLPLQSLEHQTGQRPQTIHSSWDGTSNDKRSEMSVYSSGTRTKNRIEKQQLIHSFIH